MAEGTLNALKREETGKQAAKRVRAAGSVPGVLYGSEVDSTSLSIDQRELVALLQSVGRNAVVNLMIGKAKKEVKTFIYDIQHDPLSGEITHVDLKQISMTEKINVTVPVHLIGTPDGVKNEGGITEHLLHTIDIACLPTDIPSEISVDIESMHIGDSVHVSDLPLDKYEVLTPEDSAVVHVVAPKVHDEDEGEGEEGLEEEMEPEVIGQEEEE